MSLFFERPETRSIDSFPWSAGGLSPSVGTAEAALRLIPVYAAVSGISDDIATMPVHAYRDGGAAGNIRLAKQPALLTDPGVGLDRIAWLNQCMMSLLLRGNAYGLVVSTDVAGWPAKVVWIHPDRVRVDEASGVPRYFVNNREVPRASMLHIPAIVMPGSVVGLSPVTLFRLQLTKGLAAQKYAAEFFEQGIMPPGVLRNKARTVTPEAGAIAKARFKAAVDGRDIFVTGNDWEWNALSVPNDDAAFLETIKAGATEVAAIYRVAPEDIGGETGGSMTYGTVELNELKRARRALMPWTRRLESALTNVMPRPQYVRFNLDSVARADLKTRMESHEIALRIGLETNPEGRTLEDRAPLTPDEIDQWQNLYGKRTAAPVTTSTTEGQAS